MAGEEVTVRRAGEPRIQNLHRRESRAVLDAEETDVQTTRVIERYYHNALDARAIDIQMDGFGLEIFHSPRL